MKVITTEKYLCEKFIEMLNEKPYDNIKVTQFAEYAEISRTTFYVYFDSISSLLKKVEDDFLASFPKTDEIVFWASGTGGASDRVPQTVIDGFAAFSSQLYIFRALCNPFSALSFESLVTRRTRDAVESMTQKQKLKISDAEKHLICECLAGAKWRMLHWWAFHENEVSPEEMAQLLYKLTGKISSYLK